MSSQNLNLYYNNVLDERHPTFPMLQQMKQSKSCGNLIEEVFHAITDETTFITKCSTDGRVQPL
jgi:hypothetical protein